MKLADALRASRDRAFWIALAPHLHVTNAASASPFAADAERARDSIRARGFGAIDRVVPRERCDALVLALRSLQNANIPTPFIFAFDEAWELAIGLNAAFDVMLGAETRWMRDVWAWLIAPAEGARGWKPHRGVTWDVRDARGAPTLLNTWIALTDVTEESACMHLVPIDRDPNFPNALEVDDVDASRAIALPVSAGSVLAWNANVLHWGGEMAANAPARASASFSIRAVEISDRIDPRALTFDERIDVVAEMIATYASLDGVDEMWREWAGLDLQTRAVASRR